MLSKLKRHYLYIIIAITLLFVVFLSYGQTINMFYWIDDWGLLFHMIHPDILPGNLGHPAYRHLATPFVFFYSFFGINATAYFALGIIQFYLLSIVVFLFVNTLTKNIWLGLCASILFASGYVGSYAMYRISNSYQLIQTSAIIIFATWSLYLFYQSRKIRYYLLSILFFAATYEFFFIRAQGLLPIILATSLFLRKHKLEKKSMASFILLHLPFFLLYYFFNFLDSRVTPGGSNASRDAMQNLLKLILDGKHFELLNNFLISVTNTVIPQAITQNAYTYLNKQIPFLAVNPNFMILLPLALISLIILIYFVKTRKNFLFSTLCIFALGVSSALILWSFSIRNSVWNPSKFEPFTVSLGVSFLLFLLWVYLSFRVKERMVTLLPFGMIWVFAIVLGYYIYSPQSNLDSTSRYLMPGFIGTVLIYTSLFSVFSKLILPKLKSEILSIVIIAFFSINLIYLTRIDQAHIIKIVSEPSKKHFRILQEEIGSKNIPLGSVFYFETIQDAALKGNLLGGMPYIATAIAADFPDSAIVADSYDHLFYLIESGKGKIENVYTFFASYEDLVNTSDQFKDRLVKKTLPSAIRSWQTGNKIIESDSFKASSMIIPLEVGMVGVNPIAELVNINYPSLTPIELTIRMIAEPISPTALRFPFMDYTSKNYTVAELSKFEGTKLTPSQRFSENELIEALTAQQEKQNFQANTKVNTTTEGKHTAKTHLIDGDFETNWTAYDANWNSGQRPQEIFLDLGSNLNLKKLFWVNHYTPATPTKYTISYSSDSVNWVEVIKVENGQRIESKEVVVEDLKNINARYIKFSIYDTYNGSGYPPAIDEIWVSSEDFSINNETQAKILQCAYCFIESLEQAVKVNSLLTTIAKARISWTTNASNTYHSDHSVNFPIYLDGGEHIYTIYIPAKGSVLEKIKIDSFSLPLNIGISEVIIRSLTLEELKEKNLIKKQAFE